MTTHNHNADLYNRVVCLKICGGVNTKKTMHIIEPLNIIALCIYQ